MSEPIRLLAERLIAQGAENLPARERKLLEKIAQRLTASRNWNADVEENLTLGQRVADQVAYWGGSWPFIITFGTVMLVWISFNALAAAGAFDPYPFILLNLVLSTLAAIQAPIIMMSQNRQATRDRAQAMHDYEVNLKAELEIMALHDKLDRARIDQLADAIQRIEDRLAKSSP
jgi:uncharacterized membrane protein